MKCIAKLLISLLLIVLLTACFGALHMQQGISAFKIQDYRRAFVLLMPEAQRGQPDAQYAIGYMYYYGYGITEDKKKSWLWLRSAAIAGQPDAVKAMKILGSGFVVSQTPYNSSRFALH